MVSRKPEGIQTFDLDVTLVGRAAEFFDLPHPVQMRPILLDGPWATLLETRSATSRKMVLRSRGEDLFWKQIPWYSDDPVDTTFRHRVQATAAASGLPVPELLTGRDGTSVHRLGGQSFQMQRFVAGTRWSRSADETSDAFVTLARLHQALDGVRHDGPRADAVEDAHSHLDLLVEQRAACAEVLRFEELARRLLSELSGPVVPRDGGVVHGDWNPWNLVFSGGAVAAILDFDNCHLGDQRRDLAEALLCFHGVQYRKDTTNFSGLPQVPPPQAIAAALRDYASVRLLTDADLAALAQLVAAVAVEISALGLIRGDYHPAEVDALAQWCRACLDSVAALRADDLAPAPDDEQHGTDEHDEAREAAGTDALAGTGDSDHG